MVRRDSSPRAVEASELDVAQFLAMSSIATPMAVRVAATFRLADLISQGVKRPSEIAQICMADADSLLRLMRHLVTAGIFSEELSGVFELTNIGEILRSDHPTGLRDWLDMEGAFGRSDMAFFGLLDAVRTGRPAYPTIFGKSFWDDISDNPETLGASFDHLMATERRGIASHITAAIDWTGVTSLVDVGGGNGRQLAEIVRNQPRLRGTLVDLPSTAKRAEKYFLQERLSDQCSISAGSFFDSLPAGADLYLLSFVLHDWSDSQAERILRRCCEAAQGRGRIAIIEHLQAEEGVRPVTGMDMRMMATFGGRERTLAEFRSLAESARLKVSHVQRIPSGPSIIECIPSA